MLRHAEVHNPKDIVYGRLPRFGLSERGREQARMAARFLSTRDVRAMYTSPLLRARQTADIVREERPVPLRTSSLLLEVATSYQGSPSTILQPGFSFYEPKREPHDESMADVFDRFSRMLRTVVKRHAGETVVLVSHADPIAIMRLGLEGKAFTPDNLHATVYPARSSVTQVHALPDEPPRLSYFDVVGEGAS